MAMKTHGSLDFSSRYGSLRRLILDCPVFRQNKGEKRYNFSKLVNMKHVLHDDTHLVHFLSVDHLTMALPFNTIRNRSPSHAAYRSQQRVSYSHTLICHHKTINYCTVEYDVLNYYYRFNHGIHAMIDFSKKVRL